MARINSILSEFKAHFFSCTTEMVLHYQKQKTVQDISAEKDKDRKNKSSDPYVCSINAIDDCLFNMQNTKADNHKKFVETLIKSLSEAEVSNVSNLVNEIRVLSERLNEGTEDKEDQVLWYRGHENAKYVLLPSLFRAFGEKKRDKYGSLGALQRRQYENFRTMVEGSMWMNSNAKYGYADYIAFMQHYSTETSFLDWGEDVLVALYFAFEPIMDKSKNKTQPPKSAIYLFSPYRYNLVREYFLKTISKSYEPDSERNADFDFLYKTFKGSRSITPNLSVPYNEISHDSYILCEHTLKTCQARPRSAADSDIMQQYARIMPVAITTSRINPRITKQAGTFVAFHLDSEWDDEAVKNEDPKSTFTCAYDYLALENIQKVFLEHICEVAYKKNSSEAQRNIADIIRKNMFVTKITLNAAVMEDEAKAYLKSLGVRTGNIYPELENIVKSF